MPIRDGYKQGTPCWVDMTTDDLEQSKEFYTTVFGWEYTEQSFGGSAVYTSALKNGKKVAGLMQQSPEQIDHGPPPAWNTYIAVDDAGVITGRVDGLGGQVLMPPVELPSMGKMAAVADPANAIVGLWQPKDHIGAELVNEPGSLIWNELITDNVAKVSDYFESLFGWATNEIETPTGPYTLVEVDGETVGGIVAKRSPGENHWETYFAVENLEEMLAIVGGAGGIIDEPTDIGFGLIAPVEDPQGAIFHVMQPASS